MKSKILWILLAAVILTAGCTNDSSPKTLSNMNIKTAYSPAARFPAGSQYAFVNLPSGLDPGSEEAMIDKRIQTALADELAGKGYQPGPSSEVQFLVAYSLQVQQEIDVLVWISRQQGNEWIAMILSPENYVSGALLVQITDASKQVPVWLGVLNANIELEEVSEPKKKERIAFVVRELLKSFPPK